MVHFSYRCEWSFYFGKLQKLFMLQITVQKQKPISRFLAGNPSTFFVDARLNFGGDWNSIVDPQWDCLPPELQE